MSTTSQLLSESDYTLPIRNRAGAVIAEVLVAPRDFVWLSNFRWSLNRSGYAVTRFEGKVVYMHRLILGLQPGSEREADHLNGKRLDNRRSNLRAVTHAQNTQNRTVALGASGIRGVYWSKPEKRWIARAHIDGQLLCRRFHSADEAAAAVRTWRAEHAPFSMELA